MPKRSLLIGAVRAAEVSIVGSGLVTFLSRTLTTRASEPLRAVSRAPSNTRTTTSAFRNSPELLVVAISTSQSTGTEAGIGGIYTRVLKRPTLATVPTLASLAITSHAI